MTTATVIIAQREYIGGPSGDPRIVWQDIKMPVKTVEEARATIERHKRANERHPNRFETGRFRVIQRETIVNITVMEEL